MPGLHDNNQLLARARSDRLTAEVTRSALAGVQLTVAPHHSNDASIKIKALSDFR
jgi:hypothetical protein